MLGQLYNDEINIAIITGGDNRSGFTYSYSTINGAEQGKARQTELSDGRIIKTEYSLNCMDNLDIAKTRIVKGDKKLEIQVKNPVKNHLFGILDHYEYLY